MVRSMVVLLMLCMVSVSSLPLSVSANGQIRPQGIYLDDGEIAEVRERKDREPWKSAYRRVQQEANAALVNSLHAVTDNGGGNRYFTEPPYCGWTRYDGQQPDCRDGQINPIANRRDYEKAIIVGRDARALGLAYRLTGDDVYARRVVDIIRVWALSDRTGMEPRFGNDQSRIELSITMPGLFYGADLIRDYPGWSVEHQNQFFDWVDALMEAAEEWHGTNNFELWRLVLLASGGALIDDEELLERTFDRWKVILPQHVGEDGEMVRELGRTQSLMYSLYALNALVQVAEIAEHRRVYLYDYEAEGRSIRLALDYHAYYAVRPSQWPHRQDVPIEAKDVAIYEVAYHQYRSELYESVLRAWDRPLYETRTMGPVTLTHGRVYISPVTPTPEPPPDDLLLLLGDATETHHLRLRDCPAGEVSQCWAWISSGQWARWDDLTIETGETELCVRAARWSSGPGATFAVLVEGEEMTRIRVHTPAQRFADHCQRVSFPETDSVQLRVVSGHSVDIQSLTLRSRS